MNIIFQGNWKGKNYMQEGNELRTRRSRMSFEQTCVDEWLSYCFRLPPPLLRITRSLTFSAAAQDQQPISWQRRSKDQLASEGRRSLPTTDPPIRLPTFTARSGQIPMILRKITISWRWLTSRDAASWRETWVIDRNFASCARWLSVSAFCYARW